MILGLSCLLNAQTLQETIDYSIAHNYQLQILEEERAIVEEQKSIEGLWDDPVLQMGINDLQSDKPFSRNIEAMQNQFVALSQTIPLSKKLEVASQIESEKINLIEEQKEALKVNIAFGIREAFIKANNAKHTLEILDAYIDFLNKPMELLIHLSAVQRDSVDKYIKTQLLQKSYQLQRQNALQSIEIAKEQIERIGNLKIDFFTDSVLEQNLHENSLDALVEKVLERNPQLGIANVLKEVASQGIDLAREKEQADLKVTGGYYQRFDRNDYVSFSVAYPLFVRGKQEKQRVQALRRANIQNLSYEKTKVELEQALKIALHELKALHKELAILEESRLKILKLIENAKSELSIGGSLIRYYELFSKKTENALASNKKNLAVLLIKNQIRQLLGEI